MSNRIIKLSAENSRIKNQIKRLQKLQERVVYQKKGCKSYRIMALIDELSFRIDMNISLMTDAAFI